mmetsp:Transcript_44591/g.129694  ORF Transcript_44591/g.129694 Transcript_44591/m.129694 type:complete len:249 (+) Transcript_44591:2030-2776(+)
MLLREEADEVDDPQEGFADGVVAHVRQGRDLDVVILPFLGRCLVVAFGLDRQLEQVRIALSAQELEEGDDQLEFRHDVQAVLAVHLFVLEDKDETFRRRAEHIRVDAVLRKDLAQVLDDVEGVAAIVEHLRHPFHHRGQEVEDLRQQVRLARFVQLLSTGDDHSPRDDLHVSGLGRKLLDDFVGPVLDQIARQAQDVGIQVPQVFGLGNALVVDSVHAALGKFFRGDQLPVLLGVGQVCHQFHDVRTL